MNNEKGVTLVELLLALAIISMILLLIGNVQLFGQKQFTSQNKNIDQQANVRLAAKMITKEIRKANEVEIDGNTLKIGDDVFELKGTDIEKNGEAIIHHIDDLKFTPLNDGITLEITSIEDSNGKKESISTTIYTRK